MRGYDVFRGSQRQAALTVPEEGRYGWRFEDLRIALGTDRPPQAMLADLVEHRPQAILFVVGVFLIRRHVHAPARA